MKPVRFHPEAESEYLDALQHYASISATLGRRIYHFMEDMLAEVSRYPQVFHVFDPPARRHFGAGFPYAIIYLDQPDRVWIVAVAHFKQRPGYWKKRLG